MLMPILTLLSALSISGVAIFYSVIGLATIFPGAFLASGYYGIRVGDWKTYHCILGLQELEVHSNTVKNLSDHSGNNTFFDHIYGYIWILVKSTPGTKSR